MNPGPITSRMIALTLLVVVAMIALVIALNGLTGALTELRGEPQAKPKLNMSIRVEALDDKYHVTILIDGIVPVAHRGVKGSQVYQMNLLENGTFVYTSSWKLRYSEPRGGWNRFTSMTTCRDSCRIIERTSTLDGRTVYQLKSTLIDIVKKNGQVEYVYNISIKLLDKVHLTPLRIVEVQLPPSISPSLADAVYNVLAIIKPSPPTVDTRHTYVLTVKTKCRPIVSTLYNATRVDSNINITYNLNVKAYCVGIRGPASIYFNATSINGVYAIYHARAECYVPVGDKSKVFENLLYLYNELSKLAHVDLRLLYNDEVYTNTDAITLLEKLSGSRR